MVGGQLRESLGLASTFKPVHTQIQHTRMCLVAGLQGIECLRDAMAPVVAIHAQAAT